MESKPLILHLDLDCFFIQVEQNRNPVLRNEPLLAVQQHDDLICVSYEARKLGIKKHMKPREAMEMSNNKIRLVHVEYWPGTSKVTYRAYRKASYQIFKCIIDELNSLCNKKNVYILEKSSIDEMYLDISSLVNAVDTSDFEEWISFETKNLENRVITTPPSDPRILIACQVANFLRKRVKQLLRYDVSVGIGPSKMIAKLASQQNKPKHQTLIYESKDVIKLFEQTKWEQIPNFGKLFSNYEQLLLTLHDKFRSDYCGQLQNINKALLLQSLDLETVGKLLKISQGEWEESVIATGPSQSLMVSMSLTPIDKEAAIKRVIHFLVLELMERMEEDFQQNSRLCSNLHFRFRMEHSGEESISIFSTSTQQKISHFVNGKLSEEVVEKWQMQIVEKCWQEMIKKHEQNKWKLRWIGLQISSFETIDANQMTLSFDSKISKEVATENSSTDIQMNIDQSKFIKDETKWEITCPICNKWLLKENATLHVNEHFLNEQEISSSSNTLVTNLNSSSKSAHHKKRVHPQQGRLDQFITKKKKL